LKEKPKYLDKSFELIEQRIDKRRDDLFDQLEKHFETLHNQFKMVEKCNIQYNFLVFFKLFKYFKLFDH